MKLTLLNHFVKRSTYSFDRLKAIQKALHLATYQKKKLLRINLTEWFGDWRDEAVKWWNSFCDNGWVHKRNALHLWGETNTGKSTFVREFLCRGLDKRHNFYSPKQSTSDFIWAVFNESSHVIGNIR